MTIKQKKYIEAKLRGDNGTQAAIKAGYSPKSARKIASENQTKPDIISEIDKGIARIEAKTNITIEFIQKEHARIQLLAEEKGDISTANACLTAIGKTIGAYRDNLTTDNTTRQELNAMQQQELEQIARETKIRLSQKIG
jgi:phage terminase small subunit